jgi:hypothetical protein
VAAFGHNGADPQHDDIASLAIGRSSVQLLIKMGRLYATFNGRLNTTSVEV